MCLARASTDSLLFYSFHDKLNVAHEYLQDSTLENFMSLTEIANDFTAPSTWTTADDMYAILGAIFCG